MRQNSFRAWTQKKQIVGSVLNVATISSDVCFQHWNPHTWPMYVSRHVNWNFPKTLNHRWRIDKNKLLLRLRALLSLKSNDHLHLQQIGGVQSLGKLELSKPQPCHLEDHPENPGNLLLIMSTGPKKWLLIPSKGHTIHGFQQARTTSNKQQTTYTEKPARKHKNARPQPEEAATRLQRQRRWRRRCKDQRPWFFGRIRCLRVTLSCFMASQPTPTKVRKPQWLIRPYISKRGYLRGGYTVDQP